MEKIKLNEEQKKEILQFLDEEYRLNLQDLSDYRKHLWEIYEAVNVIKKSEDRYINFANNILNLFVAKVMTRIPKISVKANKIAFFEWEDKAEWLEREQILERNNRYASAIDDYLNVTFKNNKIYKKIKRIVRSMWAYWRSYSQITTGYKTKNNIREWKMKIISKFPKLDQVSTEEIIYNPNQKDFSENFWYFIKKSWVRLRDLSLAKNNKWWDKYFDLDKAKKLSDAWFEWSDAFEQKIKEITWVWEIKRTEWLDKNSLNLIIFEGFYSLDWKAENEKLYEITTINNTIIIWFEEIENFSIRALDCFEDLEIWTPSWIIAPIIELQKDINFEKTAKKKILVRKMNWKFYWDPMSWVDPNDIIWNSPIIKTNHWIEKAISWVQEYTMNDLPSYYFSDINDMQRDIQKLTYTVDVTQAQGQSALTNTATWAKISFFESNTVIADIRENIKDFFTDISYQILDWVYQNIEDSVDIKNLEDKEIVIDREVFKDALERYEIMIEAGTIGLDTQAEVRENAIALKNILLEAMQAWVPIDIIKAYNQLFSTFDWIDPDSFIKKEENNIMNQQQQIPNWGQEWQIENTWAAELTNNLLKWWWIEIEQ